MRIAAKSTSILLVFLCVSVIYTGCSSEMTYFSLDEIKIDENGQFCGASFQFGGTVAQTEEMLRTDLQPHMQTDSVEVFTTKQNSASLSNQTTPFYLEFKDNRLFSVYTTWESSGTSSPAPSESDFDTLYEHAVELFGNPTTSKLNEPLIAPDGTDFGISITEYIWIRETEESITQLHLVMDKQDNNINLISLIMNTRTPD